MARSPGIGISVLDGVVAGAIATWALNRVTTFMYEREKKAAKDREERVRGGKTSYEVAAQRTAALVGKPLNDEQASQFGTAIHWMTGIGAGVLYALLTRNADDRRLVNGLLFGTAFWALIDEGANTVLKFTPPPREFPWQAHARGLAGHLAFGAVADRTLAAANR